MEFTLFFIGIAITIFILSLVINKYEKTENKKQSESSNTFIITVICFGMLSGFLYLIINNIDTGKLDIFGYKFERGLIIYLFIIMIVGFIL